MDQLARRFQVKRLVLRTFAFSESSMSWLVIFPALTTREVKPVSGEVLAVMIWQLSLATPLADNNGLFWRITQHSGAEVLPQVSSHMLVSVHLFLEMLHYGVWIIALPLIGRIGSARFWEVKTVPIARHPKGFPRVVAAMLVFAVVAVIGLWCGFSVDYATTRDVYFTIAIAHVLAEAPFLLRML